LGSGVAVAALTRRVAIEKKAVRQAIFAQNQPVYRFVIHLRIAPLRKHALRTYVSAMRNIAAFHQIVSLVGIVWRAVAPLKRLWASSVPSMRHVDRAIVSMDYAAMRCVMAIVWRAAMHKPES